MATAVLRRLVLTRSAFAIAPRLAVAPFRSFSARNVAGSVFYTKDHEYIRVEAPGKGIVGISDFAQKALGEIVFVDLPEKVRSHARSSSLSSQWPRIDKVVAWLHAEP